MAPLADDAEAARPVFAGLRKLRHDLVARDAKLPLTDLSMGMSGDFEVAIEEGATMVRIGTSLFEGLEDPNE
jgi:PLP dependent protein